MSDYNSSLPTRTQNNGDIVAFLADGTISTQLLGIDSSGRVTVKMEDGSGNAITSQTNGAQRALDVGINVAGVQIDPRAIRALTSSDIITADQGGTWTVQPGNTANTTPWLMTISTSLPAGSAVIGAVTQSGTWTVATNADGSPTGGTAGTKSFLVGGIYNSTPPTLTTGQQASFQLDSDGSLRVNVVDPLPAGTNAIGSITNTSFIATQATGSNLHTVVDSGTITAVTAITNALPAGTNIIGKVEVTDGTNTQAVKAASTAAVATDPAAVVALSPNSPLPTGSNAIGSVLANIQVSSAAVTTSNPVPVTLVSSTPGTPIQDYHTSASLAAGSSVTFTYTVVAAHTFNLMRVWSSASGKLKAVVNNNGSPIMVGFNSTATPNIDMTIVAPPTIAAGNTVTVVLTNDDKAAMDVYCTIEGNQN